MRQKFSMWKKKLGKKTLALMKQFEIRYDPNLVIPADDGLADRVYQAAMELFLDLGVYCTDTQRVLRFTRKELQWALENVPQEVQYGREKETVSVYPRKVEDKRDPVCFFSAVGTPVTEEMFVPVARSFAQEPLADTFSGPLITSYKGMLVTSGSPIEVEAAIWKPKCCEKQQGKQDDPI